jgi:hypothetical protein
MARRNEGKTVNFMLAMPKFEPKSTFRHLYIPVCIQPHKMYQYIAKKIPKTRKTPQKHKKNQFCNHAFTPPLQFVTKNSRKSPKKPKKAHF